MVVCSITTGENFNFPVDDLDNQGSVFTTVAVDSVGYFYATGTRTGVITPWLLKRGQPVRRQLLKLDAIRLRVLELVLKIDSPLRVQLDDLRCCIGGIYPEIPQSLKAFSCSKRKPWSLTEIPPFHVFLIQNILYHQFATLCTNGSHIKEYFE